MTDQDLAQAVADRLWKMEAELRAIIESATATRREKAVATKKLRVVLKVHASLDRAHALLVTTGDVAPLSGGGPKP